LTKIKNEQEDLKKFTIRKLLGDKEKGREGVYWKKGKLQELLTNIENGNLNQTVIEVIKKWKRDAKTHLGFIDALEELNGNARESLKGEISVIQKQHQETLHQKLEEERVKTEN